MVANAKLRTLLWIGLCAPPAGAADFSLGVKGGVALSDFFRPGASGNRQSQTSYASKPVRYTVGPAVEFALPFRLAVEASALYQRFHYNSVGHEFNTSALFERAFTAQTTGNAWSFPVLLKARPFGRRGPYVAAGPVARHLGGMHQAIDETIRSFPIGGPNTIVTRRREVSDPKDLGKRWYPGVAVAGGFDVKLAWLRVSPELRYTRWTANTARDGLPLRFPGNQFDVLLGVRWR